VQIADAIRHDCAARASASLRTRALQAVRGEPPTIRQALDVLVEEGLLYRHAGRGTFSTPRARPTASSA